LELACIQLQEQRLSFKDVLSKAFTETKIHPDLVISGHVHNYQRFTLDDQYPYIIIGNSGYWHLHGMKEKGLQVPADLSEQNDTKTVLEKYVSDRLQASKAFHNTFV
jgi:acid phosphatase type 7